MSNQDSTQNIPALRLDGFEGEWVDMSIGQLFGERNESFLDGELLSVTTHHGIKRFSDIGRHNTSNEDKSKYKLVEVGDIAYNSMRMWQGASGVSPWRGIVSPAYTVLKPLTSLVSEFYGYYFKTESMIASFKLNSQGLTPDTWNLKYPTLSPLTIYWTSIAEQHAIGAVLTNLDAVIDQHTDKHRVLQRTKTALMQKMFPQDGQTESELRLDGFEGEWTHREVGDFVDVLAHNSLSRDQLTTSNTGIANVHYGDILIKFGAVLSVKAEVLPFVRDVENLKNVRGQTLIDGDIVFADAAEDASVGKCTEIRETFGCKVVAGLHTIPVRPREVFGDGFLGYAFNSDSFRNQLLPKMQGTKVSSISATVLKESRLALPPTVEEQQAIGAVFTKLDTLISAEAQLIEKLKQTKTALLQKMFV